MSSASVHLSKKPVKLLANGCIVARIGAFERKSVRQCRVEQAPLHLATGNRADKLCKLTGNER